MDPIWERVTWFALGVVVGAIASWHAIALKRVHKTVGPASVEPPGAAPAPEAASGVPRIEAPAHHQAPASSRVIDVGAARAAGFNLRHADDLTIVEGIGPRTEDQLRANGVDTFIKVACLSVDALVDILDRGGPSFRFANPGSWPQQASLAAQNRWKELKQMQNQTIDPTGAAGDS